MIARRCRHPEAAVVNAAGTGCHHEVYDCRPDEDVGNSNDSDSSAGQCPCCHELAAF